MECSNLLDWPNSPSGCGQELSGGQRRRVAIAARPRLILYDESTTGLDQITSTAIDDEIISLRDILGISSIMVTHQLRDAYYVATHQAVMRGEQVELFPPRPRKMPKRTS